MWEKYFIVDNSVPVPSGLKFGRGFMGFQEGGELMLTYNSSKVKLYDNMADVTADFDKISGQVDLYHITINMNTAPNIQVAYNKVSSK